jgi:hypothetical protein
MRYSLRRALSLDSVDGCTHNPTIRSAICRFLTGPEILITRSAGVWGVLNLGPIWVH